jgi:hypothetical protein
MVGTSTAASAPPASCSKGVSDDRRTLLNRELLEHGKGRLFQIANPFAVRHQNSIAAGRL